MTNVFYHYLAQSRSELVQFVKYDDSDNKSNNITYSLCECVSKLDFMIIFPRAKSEMNYLQNSSQLCLLGKCKFDVM
jgi:hypothetical protein